MNEPPPPSPFEKAARKLRDEIAEKQTRLNWLEAHRAQLDALPFEGAFFSFTFDYDHLNHAQIVQVIKAFGGSWTKTPCIEEAKLNYECMLDGVTVRCWAGQPPPSCKIVEVDEEVPAQPATTRKVRKLVCQEAEA